MIYLTNLAQLKVDGNPLSNLPPNISGGAAVFNFIALRVQQKSEQLVSQIEN